uniref:Uncharacterized protein n=1 Tax=Phlegmariurus squarrosus TaxID=73615 RepID=H9M871_PHLSQ|nr:hypothetical protein HusqMp95 [Phlegmariurus squarrosus]AEV55778.1 hypothetical protein HusqMp95 [Phlegmariurus squarrosus]
MPSQSLRLSKAEASRAKKRSGAERVEKFHTPRRGLRLLRAFVRKANGRSPREKNADKIKLIFGCALLYLPPFHKPTKGVLHQPPAMCFPIFIKFCYFRLVKKPK